MSAPPAAAAAAATTCVHFKTEWVANGSVSLGLRVDNMVYSSVETPVSFYHFLSLGN